METYMYNGFEIDAEMKLTKMTKKVLNTLKKHKQVIFERDDSPEGYKAMEQLIDIAGCIGLVVFPEHLERMGKEELKKWNFPYAIAILSDPAYVS